MSMSAATEQIMFDEMMRVRKRGKYSPHESNYERLFGTPERAARTLSPDDMSCWWCLLHDHCKDECLIDERGRLLEWLRGESDD